MGEALQQPRCVVCGTPTSPSAGGRVLRVKGSAYVFCGVHAEWVREHARGAVLGAVAAGVNALSRRHPIAGTLAGALVRGLVGEQT